MNSIEYLNFLKVQANEKWDYTLFLHKWKTIIEMRKEQFGDPELSNAYDEIYKNKTSNTFFIEDESSKYLNEYFYTPIKKHFKNKSKEDLEKIPLGVINIRSVNGCTMLAPNGEKLIILNQGLLTMCQFFSETMLGEVPALASRGYDMDNLEIHLLHRYKFIVDYFDERGQMEYPSDFMKMPSLIFRYIMMHTYVMEAFIILHEIGHIELGHLKKEKHNSVKINQKTRIQIFKTETKNEFEADLFAIEHLLAIYKKIPILKHIPLLLIIIGVTTLFHMLTIIEKNREYGDKFSTHPPSLLRLSRIASYIYENTNNKEIREHSITALHNAATIPNLREYNF